MRGSFERDREYDDAEDARFTAGQDEATDRVADFCTKILENQEIQGDVVLELRENGRGTTRTIKTWIFSQTDDASEMASVIVDQATSDGEGGGAYGATRYLVTIKGRKGRTTFALDFPKPREDDDSPHEPATERGVLALVMRQNQNLHKSMGEMFKVSMSTMRGQLQDIAMRNAELERSQIDQVRAVAELYDRRAERDMAMKRLERAEERKDEALGMITNIAAPVALSKVLGTPMPGSSPLEMLSGGFFRTLRPEQLEALARSGVLTQEQLWSVHETMKFLIEQEARAQASADMRAAERGSPRSSSGEHETNASNANAERDQRDQRDRQASWAPTGHANGHVNGHANGGWNGQASPRRAPPPRQERDAQIGDDSGE